MLKKGDVKGVTVIYRVVVHEDDDLDLTRAEAVYVRDALTMLLSPKSVKSLRRMPQPPKR